MYHKVYFRQAISDRVLVRPSVSNLSFKLTFVFDFYRAMLSMHSRY